MTTMTTTTPILTSHHDPQLRLPHRRTTSTTFSRAPHHQSATTSLTSRVSMFDNVIIDARTAYLFSKLGYLPTLIWRKNRSLLNPFRPDPSLNSSDPDLSGPFLYYISFSLFQLLAEKVQFGIILGWIAISSVFLYSVLNFLAGRHGSLDLYRCVSVVGYCLMSVVLFSAAALFLPPIGSSVVVAAVFVVWATRVCSRLLAKDSLGCSEHRVLIAFPCLLIYTLFSLLVMF
ncbi:hypothetical protein RND81_02G160700 [Saponaria officinalis]|uniref:Protein YIP n=1 Tax=Saponaria officinalis TaxID=3572 RepID=A0AAW1MTX7_SAPOF